MSAEILKTIAGEVCGEALAELSRLENTVKCLKEQSQSLERSNVDAFKVIAIDQITHNRGKLGHDVIAILEDRDQRIKEIEKRMIYENSHVTDYESMLSKLNFKIDAEQRLIQQKLLNNNHYQKIKLKLTKLVESSGSIEDNMSIVVGEMEEKREEYHSDPVFSYLLKKGYDTQSYTAKGVEKYFDKRLATKYHYQNNHSNYSTILRVIDAAGKRANEIHNDIARLQLEVASIEQENSDNDNIKSLFSNKEKLQEKINKALMTRQSISDELLEYNAKRDESFVKALDMVINIIKNFAIEAIIKMVSCTPSEKDNAALENLLNIKDEIFKLNNRINDEKDRIKLSEKNLKRAKNVEQWVAIFSDSNKLSNPINNDRVKEIIKKAVSEGWYQSELTESLNRLLVNNFIKIK